VWLKISYYRRRRSPASFSMHPGHSILWPWFSTRVPAIESTRPGFDEAWVRSGRTRRECFRCGEGVWLIRHDLSSGHARAHIFLRGGCHLYGREPASACPVPALHRHDDRRRVRDRWYLVGVFRLSLSVLICFPGGVSAILRLSSSSSSLLSLSPFTLFTLPTSPLNAS
jgi:hypothetical protein